MEILILYVIFVAIASYLIGSLNFAILVSRLLYKKDIRTFGSGNAGMTNILRTFGKSAAALTIIGDIGKGTVSVLLAKMFFTNFLGYNVPAIAYIAAIAAVMGHLFPIYFRFKGGKGVSVAAGSIIAIEPLLVIILFFMFILIIYFTKIVSLASIVCAIIYPAATFAYLYCFKEQAVLCTVLSAIIAALVIYMHRDNIRRLIAGTEYKFGQKKSE